MARKNPIGKIKDVALDALLHPVGTAGKAVEQAKDGAAIGRMVAGQVTRTAAGVVGAVVARGSAEKPASETPARPVSKAAPGKPADPAQASASAVAADAPSRPQGDPVRPLTSVPTGPEATKAPAKKATAKKATAKQVAAKKSATPDPGAKKAAAPAKKAAAKKAPAQKSAPTPADMPAAPGEPSTTGVEVDVTPADIAKVIAKKAPAKKATAKKSTTTKAPAKKAPAKQAAAKKAPTPGQSDDTVVYTSDSSDGPAPAAPSTGASDTGSDTGHLEQPLLDPADAKALLADTDTGAKAADPDRG